MPIDVARVRAETPGCAHVLHFNNAGAALMPQPVLDAQVAYLAREAEIGGYEVGAEMHDALMDTYGAVAEMLGARPAEIALLENATRAWQAVFYGMTFKAGDRILTDVASYASSYIAMLQVAGRTGARIVVVPDDTDGQLDVEALEREAGDGAALVALTHVPTNGGLVNPAEEVGRITLREGIPYLLDACQSAGQMPLDVDAIGCDALSATGRKYLRGPRGTGFLYVRKSFMERLEPAMPDLLAAEWTTPDRYELRPDARRFESWEGFMAGKVALGTAVRYAMSIGLDDIRDRVTALAAQLRERLASIEGVTVHDKGRVRCGIVTFSSDRKPALAVLKELRNRRMNISRSVPSGALLDSLQRDLPDLARASVHYYNTEDEVERFVAAVSEIAGG
jgi:selenocysteine lyase/cysteine desulfurase